MRLSVRCPHCNRLLSITAPPMGSVIACPVCKKRSCIVAASGGGPKGAKGVVQGAQPASQIERSRPPSNTPTVATSPAAQLKRRRLPRVVAAVAVLGGVGLFAVLPTVGHKPEKSSSPTAAPTPVSVNATRDHRDQPQTVRGEGHPISAVPLVQIAAEEGPTLPEDIRPHRNAEVPARAPALPSLVAASNRPPSPDSTASPPEPKRQTLEPAP